MSPARAHFSPEAQQDLREIGLYIARDNLHAALRMIDRIYEATERLAAMPGMGRVRPELGQDYRSFLVERIVIFYRPIEGGVEVLRCAHGARDIESLF